MVIGGAWLIKGSCVTRKAILNMIKDSGELHLGSSCQLEGNTTGGYLSLLIIAFKILGKALPTT